MNSNSPDDKINQRIATIRQAIANASDFSGKERRTSRRHVYPVIQMFAPCNFFQPPEEDAFREVRCHDISRGGVSFIWGSPPDFEYVVFLLGDGTDRVSLTARVVHHSPIAGLEGEFLVCCEFLDRITTW